MDFKYSPGRVRVNSGGEDSGNFSLADTYRCLLERFSTLLTHEVREAKRRLSAGNLIKPEFLSPLLDREDFVCGYLMASKLIGTHR